MTTQESLLSLARAVYGDAAHVGPHYDIPANGPIVYTDCMVRIATDNGIDIFDPANNDAQAMEVLCWLLKYRCHDDASHMVKPECVGEYTDDPDDHFRICGFQHDNTPASLRSAIVQAACRVVAA